MRILSAAVYFGLILCDLNIGHAIGKPLKDGCKSNYDEKNESVVATICKNNRVYKVSYDAKINSIILSGSLKSTVLQRIPKDRDPQLVGTDAIIGFLPEHLQPYKNKGILVYFSSMRTNSGGGGGQCGSGAETYLNFLDISRAAPKIRSSLLIGSCKKSVEIVDQEMVHGKFGNISLSGETLALDFLFYGTLNGNLVGKISTDFKELIFE